MLAKHKHKKQRTAGGGFRIDSNLDDDENEEEGDEDEDGPVRPKVVTAQNTQSFIDLMRPLFAQANARCRDAERELTESQVCACVRAHCAGLEAHLTASCRASELSTLAHL